MGINSTSRYEVSTICVSKWIKRLADGKGTPLIPSAHTDRTDLICSRCDLSV
jgi:hypothetical protein